VSVVRSQSPGSRPTAAASRTSWSARAALHGGRDWREVLPAHAPFDLIFVDGGRAKDDPDAVLALAAPGATLVLDEFSADWQRPDPRRDVWLAHPRLVAVEIGTGPTARVVVAVVRR
jgi:predicted O-methyltransferase YrrM